MSDLLVSRRGGEWRVRVRGGWIVLPRRGTIVTVVLVAIALVTAVASMMAGDFDLSVGEVLRAIVAPGDDIGTTIVRSWRAPRTALAVLGGAALGLSGAIFQTLTRNPLGSPDIIGFTTGAYTGAVVVSTTLGASNASVALGATVGGVLTALVVYSLAYRNGVDGFRLIVVGVAVTALLHAVNSWLLLRARAEVAMTASIWGAGTLALTKWSDLVTPAIGMVVLVPALALLSGALRQLELGDDAASAHGVHAERSRLALVVVGVGLVAVVTAAAGPIAFVALAAPQVARGLAGGAGLPLVASAMTGAVLLVSADYVAQHVLPSAVPVGLVTLVLGGIYLLGILVGATVRKM